MKLFPHKISHSQRIAFSPNCLCSMTFDILAWRVKEKLNARESWFSCFHFAFAMLIPLTFLPRDSSFQLLYLCMRKTFKLKTSPKPSTMSEALRNWGKKTFASWLSFYFFFFSNKIQTFFDFKGKRFVSPGRLVNVKSSRKFFPAATWVWWPGKGWIYWWFLHYSSFHSI